MALDPVTASILTLRESDRERFVRYQLNWLYYKAHEYEDELGQRYVKDKKLFKHIARILGYVTDVVDADARFVMKRRLSVDSEKFQEDIYKVWERSNFQSEKYKLVRFGANLGDAFLILRDDSNGSGTVDPVIIVANSEDMRIEKDPDDQTKTLWAHQTYIYFDEQGKKRVRDWLYYPDRVECYTDERMDEGYPVDHPFGEVPVVHIKNLDIGELYGLSSWHNVEPQLDRINQLGSYTDRILLRYADPSLLAYGMRAGTGPTMRRGLNEDKVYYIDSADARMELLEYQGNVLPQIMDIIDRIDQNIKDELPELSLSKIREQSGLSGYAVSLHAADFIAKIEELRGNYANGIEWINALAIRAMMRSTAPLEEFANQVVFESVFPVDRAEQLAEWGAEADLGILSRREMLRRDGLTEKQIEERLQEVEDDRGAQGYGIDRIEAMLEGMRNHRDDEDDDEDDDDDEGDEDDDE